jgi:hypothetical protein
MKLEDLKKLCSEATPGPWTIEPRDLKFYPVTGWKDRDENGFRQSILSDTPDLSFDKVMSSKGDWLGAHLHPFDFIQGPEEPGRGDFTVIDAYFIAAARTYLPKLIAVAEAAMAAINDGLFPTSHSGAKSLLDALADLEAPE